MCAFVQMVQILNVKFCFFFLVRTFERAHVKDERIHVNKWYEEKKENFLFITMHTLSSVLLSSS